VRFSLPKLWFCGLNRERCLKEKWWTCNKRTHSGTRPNEYVYTKGMHIPVSLKRTKPT
jgi:hypothetical protein